MPRKKARALSIERIEIQLKKHKQRALADVVMRDIIVVGDPGESSGEYSGSEHESDVKKLRDEPEKKLVRRMSQQIQTIANRAAAIHFADNFVSGDSRKILPNKKNNVTRVSFNEFYFYPYRKRGPLSATGFSALFKSIDVMARKLPENLHLILASFPVVNERNHVRNLVIHVQCGKKAALKVFGKMVPADNDLEYKETVMPTLFGQGSMDKLLLQANNLKRKVMNQLYQKTPVLNVDKLKRLRHAFLLLGVKLDSEALKMIDQWLAKPKSDIVESDDFVSEVSIFNLILIKALQDAVSVLNQEKKSTIHRVNQADLSGLVLHHQEPEMPKIHYGGYVPCMTSGGAEFLTVIDICLDHACGFAKKAYFHERQSTMPVLMPNIISQVVTSNTISLKESSIFGESVVHADPLGSSIQRGSGSVMHWKRNHLSVETEEVIEHPQFGGGSSLLIYPPRLLGRVGGKLGDTIDQFNAVSQVLQLKLTLACQYPTQADIAQCIKDVGLRMAFMLNQLDQIEALMQEGADVAYQDERGVSTLSLASESKKLFVFIKSEDRLLTYFNTLLSTGHQQRILRLFDEIVKCHLSGLIHPSFSNITDPFLRYEFLRVAIKRGDATLMAHLMSQGVDPFVVDGETGLSLFEDALTHDNEAHAALKVMLMHIFKNAHLTTRVLIDALNDVKDTEKALRFYLLIALGRNDPELFAQAVALGANYFGQNPTASHSMIKPIFNSASETMKAIVFLDALNHHRLNKLIGILMNGSFEFEEVVDCLARCLSENPGHELDVLDLMGDLAKSNQYDFLVFIRDAPFMKTLSVEAQALVVRLLHDFDVFQSQVELGDVKGVAQCLANGVSPNVTLKNGMAVVLHAICSRDQALLECLLDAGVDLRLTGNAMHSPFAYAVEQLNWPAVSLIYDRIKLTPHYESYFDNEMKAKIEFKINEEIMDMVNMNGDEASVWEEANLMMRVAQQIGVMPNFNQNIFGMTPLSKAVSLHNLVTVAWLFDHGAPLDSVDEHGLPLISAAVFKKDQAMFDYFIACGVPTMLLDDNQRTPLYYAICYNQPEMLARLLALNAGNVNLNEIDAGLKAFPFLYAVKKGYVDVMKVLLHYGADMGVVDTRLEANALMVAILGEYPLRSIKFLLANGADPNGTTKKRSSLTCLIKYSDNINELKAFLSCDTLDVNLPEPKLGMTALHVAVRYHKLDMMKLLLRSGANPALTDANGLTPLDYANEQSEPDAAEVLLRHAKAASTGGKKKGHAKAATSLWAPVKQENKAPTEDRRIKKDKR